MAWRGLSNFRGSKGSLEEEGKGYLLYYARV